MREVLLRPEAEADIDQIADYTIGEWGHGQARLYIGDLRRAIERLSTNALRHPAQGDVLTGLRKLSIGHHLVFYYVADTIVDVVRILHQSRDVRRHLGLDG